MSTITPAATYPVNAPFNTNPSYSGTFIPTLWSSKLNAKFYAATVFGEIANTDWEGEIKNKGDKVIINNIPSITISDYVAGAGLSYEVPTPNTIEMPVDKGKSFAFQVNDVLAHQSQPALMNMFTDDASEQMKVSVDATVLAGVFDQGAAANMGATAGVRSASYNLGTDDAPVALSGSNILSLLTSLSGVLDEQNVPESGRWLVIDPATRQWLMQSNLAQAQFMGDSSSMIRNGRIGQIDRFTVYVSNQLPTAAAGEDWVGDADVGTAKRRAIMAGHRTAITFASQMSKVEMLKNPNDFGDYCRGLNIFGYKVIKPESLALAVVA
jgi:hypothetical protein